MEVTKKIPSLRFPGFEGAWKEKKLGEVVQNKIKGNTPDYENPKNLLLNNDFMENQAIPIYVGNEIDVKANDLLILWDGSQAGKVYTGFEGVLGSTFTAINFDSDASHLFIYNTLSHNLSTIQRVWREGSGIPHVAKDFIKNYKIQLPSLPEQQKIADCLTAMDDTIEAQQQKVEQLQAYKKGLLQQLFSQTLRFPGFVDEWEEKKLKDVCYIQGGYAFKSDDFTENGTPVVRIGDVHNIIKLDNFKTLKTTNKFIDEKFLIKKGDLLIALTGSTTAKAGIYSLEEPSYLNQRVGLFRQKNSQKLYYPFLYALVNSNSFCLNLSRKFAGCAQFNISIDDIESFKVIIPKLSEQQKIADCLSTLDEIIELEQRKLEQLRLYKKGLLQQMFV